MSTMTTSSRISHIVELVGPALLLPWPARSKGGRRKWKHLQLTDMDADSHLANLEKAGNIGIALGEVSSGLVTIDFDEDGFVDAFLEANPPLRNTLRTHGSRGCNIWVRCSEGYPASQKLKNSSEDDIGEWRADGNQTIITGTHPEGMVYRFVVESPAITIPYDAIIWPECILPPHATESKRVRRVRENEVVSVSAASVSNSLIEAFRTGDLISQVAPTDYRQNNHSLFKLARLRISFESAIGRAVTEQELEFIFDRWCLVSRRFWRHTRDQYWAEFLEACYYARVGLDEDPIELACNRARGMPLPEVTGFSDERVRLLAAMCAEMDQITGGRPFFLPTRKLGRLLDAHWSSIARWLVNLEVLGLIQLAPGEVRTRGGNRCPRYHYGPRAPKTEALPVAIGLAPSQLSALTDGRSNQHENTPAVEAKSGADGAFMSEPATCDKYAHAREDRSGRSCRSWWALVIR